MHRKALRWKNSLEARELEGGSSLGLTLNEAGTDVARGLLCRGRE